MTETNLPSFRDSISFLNEAAYHGNVGLAELFQFYDRAGKNDPQLIEKVKTLLAQKKNKEVWKIVQDYLGVQLKDNITI